MTWDKRLHNEAPHCSPDVGSIETGGTAGDRERKEGSPRKGLWAEKGDSGPRDFRPSTRSCQHKTGFQGKLAEGWRQPHERCLETEVWHAGGRARNQAAGRSVGFWRCGNKRAAGGRPQWAFNVQINKQKTLGLRNRYWLFLSTEQQEKRKN